MNVAALSLLLLVAVALGAGLYFWDHAHKWLRSRRAAARGSQRGLPELYLVFPKKPDEETSATPVAWPFTVRDWVKEDAENGRSGDLSEPLNIVRKTCVDKDGNIIGFGVLVLKAEMFLMFRDDLPYSTKIRANDQLLPELIKSAWQQGLNELYAVVPTEKGTKGRVNSRVMTKMGWTPKAYKQLWSRSTSENGF
jgi:hypothetical protein